MAREMRWRTAGILFYLVLVMSLMTTRVGEDFIRNLISIPAKADIYQVVLTILGTGFVLFSSDAIGFMLSAMAIFFWEGRFQPGKGGYSADRLGRTSYNLKDIIIEQYKNASKTAGERLHEKFEKQWETYSPDVFWSFIWWQYAPCYIVDWATRRYTMFFTNLSAATGVLFGLVFSALIIMVGQMGFTSTHLLILFVSLVWIYVLWQNAQHPRQEAWQMADVWVAGFTNPGLREILKTMERNIGADPKK
jgi:hypothetical protein